MPSAASSRRSPTLPPTAGPDPHRPSPAAHATHGPVTGGREPWPAPASQGLALPSSSTAGQGLVVTDPSPPARGQELAVHPCHRRTRGPPPPDSPPGAASRSGPTKSNPAVSPAKGACHGSHEQSRTGSHETARHGSHEQSCQMREPERPAYKEKQRKGCSLNRMAESRALSRGKSTNSEIQSTHRGTHTVWQRSHSPGSGWSWPAAETLLPSGCPGCWCPSTTTAAAASAARRPQRISPAGQRPSPPALGPDSRPGLPARARGTDPTRMRVVVERRPTHGRSPGPTGTGRAWAAERRHSIASRPGSVRGRAVARLPAAVAATAAHSTRAPASPPQAAWLSPADRSAEDHLPVQVGQKRDRSRAGRPASLRVCRRRPAMARSEPARIKRSNSVFW